MASSSTDSRRVEIEEEIKSLEKINKRQEARINNIEGKSLQDMSRYFLFQGVILAAVMIQTFDCRRWWVALAMNLVVGVLNVANIVVNTYEYVRCSEALDQNMIDIETRREALRGILLPPSDQEPPKPDPFVKWRRRVFRFFNVFLCFVSLVLVCACCFLNRCHPNKAHR